MYRQKRNGFTLVELLVVVTVIAVLAAILFPLFAQVKAKARQASCASNLHQIAAAGMMYVQDYDDHFPSCYWKPNPPYPHPVAVDPSISLQPYLRSWDVLYCPDRHTVNQWCVSWDEQAKNWHPNSRCIGYGYNWGSASGWSSSASKGDGLVRLGANGVVGVALSEVQNPAHTLFYGDTNDYEFVTLLRDVMPGVRLDGKPDSTVNQHGDPYEPPRHGQGNNFVFVDGHVHWLRFPGGLYTDGGPWVIPDMSMYSRTGKWETAPVP